MPGISPSSGPPGLASRRKSAPVWRVILIIAAGFVLVIAVAAALRRTKSTTEDAGELLYTRLFSNQIPAASEALGQFLALAVKEKAVPAEAGETLSALKMLEGYPVVQERDAAYFLERTLFFCQTTKHVFGDASTEQAATLKVLAYLRRNVQSGGDFGETTELGGMPMHLLWRGHARPFESAWLMATLLRFRGLHAAVIELGDAPDPAQPYCITGVVIGSKLCLFDPYRGVPILETGGGAVADLAGLLSGDQTLAPGFGGPGTPVTLEGLRKSICFLPADPYDLAPEAWCVQQTLLQHKRPEYVYRPFRPDLNVLAASIYGNGTPVQDGFVVLAADGHDEKVALWPYPFQLQSRMSQPEYAEQVVKANRHITAYLVPRTAQLQGESQLAREEYSRVLQERSDDPEVVEDVTFFRCSTALTPEERVDEFRAYLDQYPEGRWRPLAMLLLAEHLRRLGQVEEAVELAEQLPPPYELRGKLLAEMLRKAGSESPDDAPDP